MGRETAVAYKCGKRLRGGGALELMGWSGEPVGRALGQRQGVEGGGGSPQCAGRVGRCACRAVAKCEGPRLPLGTVSHSKLFLRKTPCWQFGRRGWNEERLGAQRGVREQVNGGGI